MLGLAAAVLVMVAAGCGSDYGAGGSVFSNGLPAQIISLATDGTPGNGHSRAPSQSASGRWVAFESAATDLVTTDTNGEWDVFVRDRSTNTTELASRSTAGVQSNGDSLAPSISADGRYVVFESAGTNLVVGDGNADVDVFLRDRTAGTTTRVSLTDGGAEANGDSRNAAISRDGSLVVFETEAALTAGDTNGRWDVYAYDVATGTVERLSLGTDGDSRHGRPSADGRFVVLESTATDLVADDTNGVSDVFLVDRATDEVTRVSLTDFGSQSSGASFRPSVSEDGDRVVFLSDATDLVGPFLDTNGKRDVFCRIRSLDQTARVSVSTEGLQNDDDSDEATISADGRYVLFTSPGTSLVVDDSNGVSDVFRRRLDEARTERVSLDRYGDEVDGASSGGALDDDGGYVVFVGASTGFDVLADDNGADDVVAVPVSNR